MKLATPMVAFLGLFLTAEGILTKIKGTVLIVPGNFLHFATVMPLSNFSMLLLSAWPFP